MGSPVKLYCAWFCPFAQRVWIALLEKGITFEYVEINPYNKTKEFLNKNPRGLVPVILDKGRSIYESTVCLEYIDDAWPDKNCSLLPRDPYERAQVRLWSDFISKKIVPTFYRLLQSQDERKQEEAKSSFLKNLEIFTQAMSDEGPFFCGKYFGLVDIMIFPFASRFFVLEKYRNFSVPESKAFVRFHQWFKACSTRESVSPTQPEDDKLIAYYLKYADNSAQTEVADAIRRGMPLP